MRAVLPFADDDITVDAAKQLPLNPECARRPGQADSPYEEPLFYPFSQLTAKLARAGATAVVTGLGGDELVALSQAEAPHLDLNRMPVMPPWLGQTAATLLEYADVGTAPPAPINSMTLLALESTAPPLLREGIWPIHPFAWTGRSWSSVSNCRSTGASSSSFNAASWKASAWGWRWSGRSSESPSPRSSNARSPVPASGSWIGCSPTAQPCSMTVSSTRTPSPPQPRG